MARGSEGIADLRNRIEVEEGSRNVFANIALPNPEERLAKADLAMRIGEAIRHAATDPISRRAHPRD